MKVKSTLLSLFLITACSLSGISYACGSCNTYSNNNCAHSCSNNCEDRYSWTSCSCTDPHCDGNNPCLSSGRCCKLFGNIGYSGGED